MKVVMYVTVLCVVSFKDLKLPNFRESCTYVCKVVFFLSKDGTSFVLHFIVTAFLSPLFLSGGKY